MTAAHTVPPRPRCIPTRSCRRARAGRRGAAHRRGAAGDDQQDDRHEAAADHAPPQNRRANAPAPDGVDRELVVARRARRQQVLEDEDEPRCTTIAAKPASTSDRRADSPPTSAEASSSAAAPSATACAIRSNVAVRTLPQVAREALREQEPGVAGRQHRDDDRRHRPAPSATPVQPEPRGGDPQRRRSRRARSGSTRPSTIHDRQFGRVRM